MSMASTKAKKNVSRRPNAPLETAEPPSGPMPPTLGGKLRELLTRRNLSITGAAAMAGMPKQQLFRIIQGDVPNPGILTVQRVVIALGGRMRDLFADGDLVPGGLRNMEGES